MNRTLAIPCRMILLGLLLGCTGCGAVQNDSPPATAADLVKPNRHHLAEPLTDRESSAFAADLLAAIQKGNVERGQSLMDWDAVWDTAFAGIELPPARKSQIVDGYKDSMRTNKYAGPLSNLYQTVAGGAVFHLLKVRTVDGERRALYRLATADGGLKYYEITLARRPGDQIMGTDMYAFQEGERLSERLRRLVLSHVARDNRGLLARLQPRESELAANADRIEQMAIATRTGDFQRAMDVFRSLPPSLQKEKAFILMRVAAAQRLNEKEYVAAVEEYRRYFPNDPSGHFVFYNYHFVNREFATAIECVDRMEDLAGGDPYLNIFRAAAYLEQKDTAAARRTARLATEAEGTTVYPYMLLFTVSLIENQNDETLALLKTTHEKFGVEFNDLRSEPDFARFIESPQYENWVQYCREREAVNRRTKAK